MKALILHSDDLGFSIEANRRIFKAFEEGLLSSASIMVNMPGSMHALKLATGIKGRFGLHLNLTEGFPLAEGTEVPQLTNSNGQFDGPLKLAALASRSGLNLSLRRQWRREMELQFQKACDNGLNVSHINGHHYIETFPSLREDVLNLCTRYGVRNIRVACDPTPLKVFVQHACRLKLAWALWVRRNAAALWREALTRGFAFPDVTLGVGMSGRLNPELTYFWLKQYIAKGQGRAEMIFHIGTSEQPGLIGRLMSKPTVDESETLRELASRRNEFQKLTDYATGVNL